MIPLTVGSLFSGIGGFELGLERTGGFKTVWQCEIDPFCQKVLAKHWPNVKRFTDIKKMGIEEEIPHVNVICGGFPCQPVSCAGKRKGKEDSRWLWPEFGRVVRCVRPEWVLIENVPGLLSADSGRLFAGILRDLSESGYDAEWNIVSAASVGAPHLRRRVFIVAHCTSKQNDPERQESRRSGELERRTLADGREALRQENGQASNNVLRRCSSDVANPHQIGRHGRTGMFWQGRGREFENSGSDVAHTEQQSDRSKIFSSTIDRQNTKRSSSGIGGSSWWAAEPNVGRVVARLPPRLDGSGLDENGNYPKEESEVGAVRRQILLDVWKQEKAAKASQICERIRFPDSLPEVPHFYSQEGRNLGERIEKDKELRDLWYRVLSEPFQKECHLLEVLLVRVGEKEREQAVAQRVNRLRALGNAIVPQCAQFVGQCLLDSIEMGVAQ